MGSLFSNPPYPARPYPSQPGNALLSGVVQPQQSPQWDYVADRFQRFLAAIKPTPHQHEDVQTKAECIVDCLSRKFWGRLAVPGEAFAVIVGSWGNGTHARPGSVETVG